ncbi:hypothetical protein RugamoR57_28970 [Duganella caerulea]|uniref:DUF2971 domain-containing protein n=1 Tax=Duganella caerulea TaxID=2885762 RepID=UPI0030E7F2B9
MLFKFFPPERAGIFSNGMIRFSQVAALNDPFESTAIIKPAFSIEDFIDKNNSELDELVAARLGDLTEQDLLLAENEKKSMSKWVRRRMSAERLSIDVMRKINRSIGILSLTAEKNNLLMWAHYANSHTGFVIGFDDEHEFFHLPYLNGEESSPIQVSYDNKRMPYVNDGLVKSFNNLIGQKSKVWECEKEFRITRNLEDGPAEFADAKGLGVHLFNIPKSAFKEVIFGANSSLAMRFGIIKMIRANKLPVKVFVAGFNVESFDMVFQEISLNEYAQKFDGNSPSYTFSGQNYFLPVERNLFLTALYEEMPLYGTIMPSAASILRHCVANFALDCQLFVAQWRLIDS